MFYHSVNDDIKCFSDITRRYTRGRISERSPNRPVSTNHKMNLDDTISINSKRVRSNSQEIFEGSKSFSELVERQYQN